MVEIVYNGKEGFDKLIKAAEAAHPVEASKAALGAIDGVPIDQIKSHLNGGGSLTISIDDKDPKNVKIVKAQKDGKDVDLSSLAAAPAKGAAAASAAVIGTKGQAPAQDAAAPADKGFMDRVAELPEEIGKTVSGYYEYVKNTEAGKKVMSMAEYAKDKGIELGEEGLKQAESFWDTYAPQGLKDATKKVGGGIMDFLGNNGMGIGIGIAALLGGMMLGLDPIMALLLALVGFALGGMMDGNGVMSGLFGKKEPAKAPPGPDLSKGKGNPTQTVSVQEEQMVQVVQGTGTDRKFLSGTDEKGNLTYGPSADHINLALKNAKGEQVGYLTGKPSTDGTSFTVSHYTPTLPDGTKLAAITLETPIAVQLNSKGELDPKAPVLNGVREEGFKAISAYTEKQYIDVQRGEGNAVTANIGTHKTTDGKEYTVVLSGTVQSKDGKETATFATASLVDKENNVVRGPDGGPVNITIPARSYAVENGRIQDAKGRITEDLARVGDGVLKEKSSREAAYAQTQKKQRDDFGNVVRGQDNLQDANIVLQQELSSHLESKEIGMQHLGAPLLANAIVARYSEPEFRNKSAEDAAKEIASTADTAKNPGMHVDKLQAFIANIHPEVAKAYGEKPDAPANGQGVTVMTHSGPAQTPTIQQEAPLGRQAATPSL